MPPFKFRCFKCRAEITDADPGYSHNRGDPFKDQLGDYHYRCREPPAYILDQDKQLKQAKKQELNKQQDV
jgi:hypothetical protein